MLSMAHEYQHIIIFQNKHDHLHMHNFRIWDTCLDAKDFVPWVRGHVTLVYVIGSGSFIHVHTYSLNCFFYQF